MKLIGYYEQVGRLVILRLIVRRGKYEHNCGVLDIPAACWADVHKRLKDVATLHKCRETISNGISREAPLNRETTEAGS